ncbi:MAG TPA: hypothetical protein PKW95_10680 [bacterium]|nr:hypothetical protein [bacterium]
MRLRAHYGLALLAVLLLLLSAGCTCGDDDDDADIDHHDDDSSDDDDDDDDATPDDDTVDDDDDDTLDDDTIDPAEEIEQGKLWLHYGDGDRANLHFFAAAEVAPDNPDALYGLVIGHELHIFDFVSVMVDYVETILDYGSPVKDDDPDNLLDNFLDQALEGILFTTTSEQRLVAQKCLSLGCEFEQEEELWIPLIIRFELLDEVYGHFDDAELHAFQAPSLAMLGLFEHLAAISLDLDLSMAWSIAEIDWDGDLTEAIGELVDILLYMLTDPQYPNLLTLPTENAEQFQLAGLHLALACDELIKGFEAIEADTDDQTQDILAYEDLNGDHQYTEGEPYRMPVIGVFEDNDMEIAAAVKFLAEELRGSLLDYTEYDPDPETVDPFHLSYFNELLAALGWPRLIPDWSFLTLDLGAMYAEPGHDGLKKTLVLILQIADLFLP